MPSGAPAQSSPANRSVLLAERDALDHWPGRVSRLLHTPLAWVSVIGADGEVSQSAAGLAEAMADHPPLRALTQRVVGGRQPVLIQNVHAEATALNDGTPGFAAYAGVPLLAANGDTLGVLSVADVSPRRWTDDELTLLQDLAASISAHLERQMLMGALQAAQQETEAARHALKRSETRFAKTFSLSPLILTITSAADGRLIDVNATFERLTGYTREEALGRTPVELDLWLNPVDRE